MPTLLILEVNLKKANETKLNELASNAKQDAEKRIWTMLQSVVNAAKKANLSEFSVDRVQLRVGISPPFVSTRIKYTR